ncbi:pyrroloquinoline quinone-dependent dehydrogenase [Granulicella mallensis]|uniref:Quinoprotein glucose dehydrogenase n=1 Tax=Granulicella mallensis (strain ATCC BAA-1857 / DSM 23137 / MP5ACTX8) TaxID=682795 RepID=G8NRL0_GRAMM|nr:pyrroloquinoline quinone-dependent dehydrogenase [Granulicella mallensis]AEU38451.1 Quinoprotein glucose dehydrogenase [Granulicella mallensis MP5ACTX8]
MSRTYSLSLPALGLVLFSAFTLHAQTPATGEGWPTYGGDPGGQRYSSAAQITRKNVAKLHPVWTYHTHALETSNLSGSKSNFEATPILFNETLYLTTAFDRIIALDPATGAERWTYDPHIPDDLVTGNYTSRGVAAWQSPVSNDSSCAGRIFVATLDARLIAVDAATGKPCADFGDNGVVNLKTNIPTLTNYRSFGNTSPPTVIGDVVVVGSAVPDNQAVEVEPGVVRGYDVRTGRLLWGWDPLPWATQQHPRTGAGNAWAVIAADPAHNLVFVPTGAPSPDFYGGLRPGDNKDANSIVALDARTGKKVWAFQLVHHDIWDYDVAAEPLLFDFQGHIPALAVSAKIGSVFVLNRLTGEPLYPVEERPVPASDIPDERISPTQPFSSLPPMNPLTIDPKKLKGHNAQSKAVCSAKLRSLRYDGIFTPPSIGGTLQYPGSLGGINWASMSFDPETGILYANTNGSAYEIRLIDRLHYPPDSHANPAQSAEANPKGSTNYSYQRSHNMVNSPDAVGEISANAGAPYLIYRRVLQDNDGRPCTPTPWGATSALNLNTGKFLWRKPLGTLDPGRHTGTVNFGAPIVTAGGLLFTAGTSEPLLRAIDKATGKEVWTGKLPVPAQSTPMTYMFHGRQYVVISAGGHGGLGTPLGDSVVAFALQ